MSSLLSPLSSLSLSPSHLKPKNTQETLRASQNDPQWGVVAGV